MNKQLIVALGLILFTSSTFAQTNSMSYQAVPSSSIVPSIEGFRVALLKPFLSVTVSALGETVPLDEPHGTLGFSLGYAQLPLGSLGFTTNFAYLAFENSDVGLARIDGNLGYAMNEIVNFKGGLNISRAIGPQDPLLDAAIGAQASAGFQITRNLGIDLAYVLMRQTLSIVAFNESGLELALHGTF